MRPATWASSERKKQFSSRCWIRRLRTLMNIHCKQTKKNNCSNSRSIWSWNYNHRCEKEDLCRWRTWFQRWNSWNMFSQPDATLTNSILPSLLTTLQRLEFNVLKQIITPRKTILIAKVAVKNFHEGRAKIRWVRKRIPLRSSILTIWRRSTSLQNSWVIQTWRG